MAEFYSAHGWEIPPLPWTNLSPPFSVVKAADEDHAESDFYHTIYYQPEAEFETHDGPIPFEGPHRTHDQHDWYVRTDDGWRIAKRVSHMVFRRNPDEPVSLETWAAEAGKTGNAPSS